ncbi:MAG: hypothetical protein WED87_04560 [Dehalococcoidia bacterium]
MKARRTAQFRPLYPYIAGDLLLEVDRLGSSGPVLLPLHTQETTGKLPEPKAESLLDVVKPKAEDYPALKATFQALKFSDSNVKDYHEGIGSLINLASGMIWGVGAVFTVMSWMDTLLGKEEDAVSTKLANVSQRVDQIYGYLAAEEVRGLHDMASEWRRDLTIGRRAAQQAKSSRSPENMKALRDLRKTLDENLLDMLNPNKANIAFLRATYGWKDLGGQGGHWIDGAASPFMKLASAGQVNYRDPAQELQANIWDAGHYIDVLVQSLNDRLLVAAALEPAYRTTGHGLGNIKDIMLGLGEFLNRWRSSLLVFDPLVGLNNGGELLHPVMDAPAGVMIGAVDPVSGVGFYDMWWAPFALKFIWEGSIQAKGNADESRAVDPKLANTLALDLQPRLINGVIAASGIPRLAELRVRLQDIVMRSTVGSDFVDLPNANFDRVSISGPETPAGTVDLGLIGNYSKNPGRKYTAEAYTQTFEKTFKFSMPFRGEESLVQPGYRMEIGSESIVLIPYANAPANNAPAPRFPSAPISQTIRGENWRVYDVYQSKLFTEADEDRFEGADPSSALGPLARIEMNANYGAAILADDAKPPFQVELLRPNKPERLFLNERAGYVALGVDVTFDADLASMDYRFAGTATVTITNLEPDRFRHGAIVPVTIYETGHDPDNDKVEWVADRMTIHMSPRFFVVDAEYFVDRRDGLAAMDEIFGSINEEYSRYQKELLPVGPEWQMRRRFLVEQSKVEALERFEREEGAAAVRALNRFRVPQLGRHG